MHASQRKFFTVWSPSASHSKSCCLLQILNCSARSGIEMAFLTVRLANNRKSVHKFNLRLLVSTCVTVWRGLNYYYHLGFLYILISYYVVDFLRLTMSCYRKGSRIKCCPKFSFLRNTGVAPLHVLTLTDCFYVINFFFRR